MKFITLFSLLFSSSLFGQQAGAVNGPVLAIISLDKASGQVFGMIEYTGYLINCKGNNSGQKVNAVIVVRHPHKGSRTVRRTMSTYCPSNGNYLQPKKSYLTFSGKTDPLMANLLTSAGAGRIQLALAFHRQGRWDSKYGRNYVLKFKRR